MQKNILMDRLSTSGYTVGIDNDKFYKNYCIAATDYDEWLKYSCHNQRKYSSRIITETIDGVDYAKLFNLTFAVSEFPFGASYVYRGINNWAGQEDAILRVCGLPGSWQDLAIGLKNMTSGAVNDVTKHLRLWPSSPFEEWISSMGAEFVTIVDNWADSSMSGSAYGRVFSIQFMREVRDLHIFEDDYNSNLLLTTLSI